MKTAHLWLIAVLCVPSCNIYAGKGKKREEKPLASQQYPIYVTTGAARCPVYGGVPQPVRSNTIRMHSADEERGVYTGRNVQDPPNNADAAAMRKFMRRACGCCVVTTCVSIALTILGFALNGS